MDFPASVPYGAKFSVVLAPLASSMIRTRNRGSGTLADDPGVRNDRVRNVNHSGVELSLIIASNMGSLCAV